MHVTCDASCHLLPLPRRRPWPCVHHPTLSASCPLPRAYHTMPHFTRNPLRACLPCAPPPSRSLLQATHDSYAACAQDALLSATSAAASAAAPDSAAPPPPPTFAMFATHHEASCASLAAAVRALPPPLRYRFAFAQLLGMGDHLSAPLAHAGLRVAKYVPYGPLHSVMPYLLRRAQENSDLVGGGHGAHKEITLLRQEIWRRLQSGGAAEHAARRARPRAESHT